MKTLGIIIAGYGKPYRFVTEIKSFEVMDDGKRAYTTSVDGSCHFDSLEDVIKFDVADAVGSIGNSYFKIPVESIDFIGQKGRCR